MKVTKKLATWLLEKGLVKADASDADCRKAAAAALVADEGSDGFLSAEKLVELTTGEDDAKASAAESKLDKLTSAVEKLVAAVAAGQTPDAKTVATINDLAGAGAAGAGGGESAAVKQVGHDGAAAHTHNSDRNDWPVKLQSPIEKALAGSNVNVRHKGAWEQYSTTKTAAVYPREMKSLGGRESRQHPKAGQPVTWYKGVDAGASGKGFMSMEQTIDLPSDLEKAVIGAVARWQLASQSGIVNNPVKMRDHDWELVQYALHELKWGGVIKNGAAGAMGTDEGDGAVTGVKERKLREHEIKALIDDSTSGGLEAAPIVFDDAIILTPLLYGELFPAVTVFPITRGRRIEGVSMTNPTGQWGAFDDTATTLFTTTSMVSAFDTTIFGFDIGIELGLDFLQDTPIDFANIITNIFGMELMQELDRVVATGASGSSEPTGVLNASGTTSVSFGSTTPTVSGYEQLYFGVAKRFKQGWPADRMRFCSSETSYRRMRAIAVGTTDERRVLGGSFMGTEGESYASYRLMGHPYAINEDIGNTKAFFANLGRYRMYRRLGLTLRQETAGKTLARSHLMLLLGRARFGGQMETGSAAAVSTTLQA